jgi:hypothetical protein
MRITPYSVHVAPESGHPTVYALLDQTEHAFKGRARLAIGIGNVDPLVFSETELKTQWI